MDTWKKILPDFTIRRWTIQDALAINNNYINQALECKKWAFAADVVRLYAIYTEGGVYMDSDIIIKKRFDQFMTQGDFVTFHECGINQYTQKQQDRHLNHEVPYGLQAAFMMGKKNNTFCKTVLEYYAQNNFLNDNGSMNMRIAPSIYAEVAETLGFQYINQKQILDHNTIILESKYFAQNRREQGDDAFGVHRISHSWKNFADYPFLKRQEKHIKHYFRVCKYTLFKI